MQLEEITDMNFLMMFYDPMEQIWPDPSGLLGFKKEFMFYEGMFNSLEYFRSLLSNKKWQRADLIAHACSALYATALHLEENEKHILDDKADSYIPRETIKDAKKTVQIYKEGSNLPSNLAYLPQYQMEISGKYNAKRPGFYEGMAAGFQCMAESLKSRNIDVKDYASTIIVELGYHIVMNRK
ncbi:MAG: hypothetical protein NDI94_00105 [Candidatus Woesearchaeota archaeon]|nr:hypothetical protein [Candidatus Woesearchaeota archaeon]